MTATAYPDLALYIDGTWTQGSSGAGEEVINPADETVLGRLPHAAASDLAAALAAAEKGLALWRRSTPETRREVLLKTGEILRSRRDALAPTMTLEQGKTLLESKLEWDRVIDTLDWCAEAALRIEDQAYPERGGNLQQASRHEPVGICLALTAWNFPAILPVRKLAPALAAGCSVILKAAEETPASALALVRALEEAGLPGGVVNLVFGEPDQVSRHLLAAPQIRKLSFTGSVPVGKHLAALAAPGLKRCTLELGGHAPAIVFADADVEAAAEALAAFKYRNAGQVCIAPSRFFVELPAYPRFLEAFLAFAEGLVLGDGQDPATTMGPMANPRRIAAMEAFMADAKANGAEVLAGGAAPQGNGYFWQPTVLSQVGPTARIMQEEPFGPIAPVTPFDDAEAVLATANALPYGLAAYVFTGSSERADAMIAGLESGSVAVNTVTPAQPDTPFGGVKDSGYGYEGGMEGITAFLNKKLVSRPVG